MQKLTEKNSEVLASLINYHKTHSEFSVEDRFPTDPLAFKNACRYEFNRLESGTHELWAYIASGQEDFEGREMCLRAPVKCFLSALSLARIVQHYALQNLPDYEYTYTWYASRIAGINHSWSDTRELMILSHQLMFEWFRIDAALLIEVSLSSQESDEIELGDLADIFEIADFLVLVSACLIFRLCGQYPQDRERLLLRLS